MSNLSDFVDAVNKGQDASISQYAGSILGLMADISGVIGLVQIIAGLLEERLQQDISLADVLRSITNNFREINQLMKAEAKLARMRTVDDHINPAVGVLYQLPAMLSNPTLSNEYKLQQIQLCLDAVNFFAEFDTNWQSVYEETPYYTGFAPPAPADNLVFNHTYTLPQFLRAIHIFLLAVAALQPDSLHSYDALLTKAANRLQMVHDTIVSQGIVGSETPSNASAIGYIDFSAPERGNVPPTWHSDWSGGQWLYGAIERFSAANNVSSYYPYVGYPIEAVALDDVSVQRFLAVLGLRIQVKKKMLYQQMGLGYVRAVTNELRTLAGGPLLPVPEFSRLRPADAAVILGAQLPPAGPMLLQSLEDYLRAMPPFCGFDALMDDASVAWIPGPGLPSRAQIVPYLLSAREPGWPPMVIPPLASALLA